MIANVLYKRWETREVLKIITENLRGACFDDGPDSWEFRRGICVEMLKAEKADIICFQEFQQPQRDELEAALPEYGLFAMLDRPVGGHPMNAIFFRESRLRMLGGGGYALSPTPSVCGSVGWGNLCPRFVNSVTLEERSTGKAFRVLNTHLDHHSQEARNLEAELLCEDAAAYPTNFPQFLCGDMNCDIVNRAMRILAQSGWRDGYREATGIEEPGFTYHGFQGSAFQRDMGEQGSGRMDFIWLRGNATATAAQLIDRPGTTGRYPSDHYFVSLHVNLAGE